LRNVLKSRSVRLIARYVLLPIVAGGLASLAVWAVAVTRPEAANGPLLFMFVMGAVLVGWIAAAVSDKGPIVRRVLLPWAPCAPILAIMIVVMLMPVHDNWEADGNGLALLAYFAMLQLAAALAAIGSVAAMVYHPGESPPRSA
jgi:hypothetical protein